MSVLARRTHDRKRLVPRHCHSRTVSLLIESGQLPEPAFRENCQPVGQLGFFLVNVPQNGRLNMSKKNSKSKDVDPNSRTICRNRKASHDYEVIEELECGIVLKGSEVKSIRNGKISINEAYARVEDDEVWLIGCDIAEYPQATVMNHEPRRRRKLLMHRSERRKFAEAAEQDGLTLVPLAVYLTRGIVKVKVAVARGRKHHDKRQKLRKQSDTREMRQAMLKRRS